MSRLIVSVSGVRGIVGETLTSEVAREFGRAFATMLGEGKTVIIGRDTRSSGEMIRDAVMAGLNAGGVNAVDLGIVSTPGVALMVGRLKADGGIVITASHNPLPYNGIKFLTPQGLALSVDKDKAAQLNSAWENKKFSTAARKGNVTINHDTHRIHIQAVCDILDVEAIRARHYKVVLDSINGAGVEAGKMLLDRLGCELVHINNKLDGDFTHEPEPIAKNLTGLCDAVRQHGADIGFAQDPDADRLVVVDENGTFIGEEYTLALTAQFILGQRRGNLATNLCTSRMIDDVAEQAGVKVFRSPTGEANVASAMVEHKCIFGGEGNGGAMDPRVVIVRDSFVGMGLLLNHLARSGKTVSQLVAGIPRYELLKDKFPCPLGAAQRAIAAVAAAYKGRAGASFDDRDGLRIDLPQGWLQIRASNTEPIMRISAEAKTLKEAQAMAQEVRKIADANLG